MLNTLIIKTSETITTVTVSPPDKYTGMTQVRTEIKSTCPTWAELEASPRYSTVMLTPADLRDLGNFLTASAKKAGDSIRTAVGK